MIDTSAIRARAEAATPGPWVVGVTWDECWETPWPMFRLRDMVGPTEEEASRDAYFIVAARSDVPALLDENDALRAELAAEKARAERLAAAADNALMNAYPVSRNTITQDVNTYSISACELEPLREALKLYMPGDLGVSDNA